ncbi:glutathione peroxidase [Piscinibacter sp. Jin2]|uniref:Glutathione peroxidase n=1 Tax=Aquariibacter lacus TaxID=2801332 RepID=A0A9X0XBU3_9BURK|nr:glutathione peroxidase [Piscinibacter lacus]MBL0718521.1 glutathione peroxidase [Piscinibacter lacus]
MASDASSVPIHDWVLTSLDGRPLALAEHRGRVLLIVNTASACGFTPQFAGLETLWRELGPQGLTVLGFPCNQFGAQDPGSAEQIGAFCQKNYGVSFPMMAKVEVNGPGAHPLFQRLKREAPGLLGSEGIKWNFTKFLVGRDGRVRKRYAPADTPAAIRRDLEAALAEPPPAA